MNVENLKKLRENYPYNWKNTIAERAKVSHITVWRVFNGKSKNRDVIREAIKLGKEGKKLDDQINSLLTTPSNTEA